MYTMAQSPSCHKQLFCHLPQIVSFITSVTEYIRLIYYHYETRCRPYVMCDGTERMQDYEVQQNVNEVRCKK